MGAERKDDFRPTLSPEAEGVILNTLFDRYLEEKYPSSSPSSGGPNAPSSPASAPVAPLAASAQEIAPEGRLQSESTRGRRRAIRGGANPTILTSPIGFFEDQTNPRKSLLGL